MCLLQDNARSSYSNALYYHKVYRPCHISEVWQVRYIWHICKHNVFYISHRFRHSVCLSCIEKGMFSIASMSVMRCTAIWQEQTNTDMATDGVYNCTHTHTHTKYYIFAMFIVDIRRQLCIRIYPNLIIILAILQVYLIIYCISDFCFC